MSTGRVMSDLKPLSAKAAVMAAADTSMLATTRARETGGTGVLGKRETSLSPVAGVGDIQDHGGYPLNRAPTDKKE